MAKPQIEVDGLKQLRKEIRRVGDEGLKQALKATNVEVANMVIPGAKRRAPNSTGALASSIRATNTVNYSAIRAGSARAVPYAGIYEFGWPARGIKARPYVRKEIADKYKKIINAYEDAIEKLCRDLNS